jgi:hypothetical protein
VDNGSLLLLLLLLMVVVVAAVMVVVVAVAMALIFAGGERSAADHGGGLRCGLAAFGVSPWGNEIHLRSPGPVRGLRLPAASRLGRSSCGSGSGAMGFALVLLTVVVVVVVPAVVLVVTVSLLAAFMHAQRGVATQRAVRGHRDEGLRITLHLAHIKQLPNQAAIIHQCPAAAHAGLFAAPPTSGVGNPCLTGSSKGTPLRPREKARIDACRCDCRVRCSSSRMMAWLRI